MGSVADIDAGSIGVHDLQAEVLALHLARQLPPLLAVHFLPVVRSRFRYFLGVLLCFGFHANLPHGDINKALEKDRNLRYQVASEMRADLQRLKRDTESGRSAEMNAMNSGARSEKPRVSAAKIVIPVASLVAVLLASALYWRSHKTAKLTDRDTIVLADFTNTTGDPVFDGTLRQGLAVQLEQSPFLSLISEQQVQRTLHMMGQPADAKLALQIAREVCQRNSGTASLEGSISQVGNQYELILKAVQCATGELLFSTEARANDKNQVLDSLGNVASQMRGKLGESLTSVRRNNIPLAQTTTSSLEALKDYSLGIQGIVERADSEGALEPLQRAIQVDPNFATAHWALGIAYYNLGESVLGAQHLRRAYELRESLSEEEKLNIEAFYYDWVLGDLEKSRKSLERI